jgi:hypothetical protein
MANILVNIEKYFEALFAIVAMDAIDMNYSDLLLFWHERDLPESFA